MMALSEQGERIFIDVHTMKCYRLPEHEGAFADLLQDAGRGVTREWLDALGDARRASVWHFLRLLASRGALVHGEEKVLSAA
jgi:hypothetical protein